MFTELRVSEELLKAKSRLKEQATKHALDGLWARFPDGSEERKEADKVFAECESSTVWIARPTPQISDHYKFLKVLGNPGQYGVVHEAINLKDNSQWAVKQVSKRRFVRNKKATLSFFADLRAEAYLMSVAQEHPYVITIIEVFEDVENMYIVMEKCTGGELFDAIQADDGFSENKAAKYMRQMVSAVYYLHGLGIAHCDLKPENFILRDTSPGSDLVLIDFGMAKIVQWRQYYKRMNGTPYYIAPEVLNGKYNESCDIWSLGVIMFIMIFGYPPFFDEKESQPNRDRKTSDQYIYSKIKKGFTAKVQNGYGPWFPANHRVSASCRDLISRLLRKSVADRINSEETLEHPWIKKGAEGTLAGTALSRCGNPSVIKSVLNFRNKGSLQVGVLKLLKECNYLNSSQMSEVKEFFSAADTDNNGVISADELFEALKKVDPQITREDVRSIMKSVDANDDGFVDYDELLTSRINRKLNSKEARLRKVFKALDLDDNGKISDSELKAALESVSSKMNMTKKQCKTMIQEADKDNDGQIDFEEFLGVFSQMQM